MAMAIEPSRQPTQKLTNGKSASSHVCAWLTRFTRWLQEHSVLWLAVIGSFLWLCDVWFAKRGSYEWDPLLFSGVITFLFGFRLWQSIPGRVTETLDRLQHRGSLLVSESGFTPLVLDLKEQSARWARYCALLIFAIILAAFITVFGSDAFNEKLPLTIFEAGAGYVTGHCLGSSAFYGALARFLKRHQIRIKVQPGHLDGAAGLRPIGELYFVQASIVAFPAAYLAVWSTLFFILPGLADRYRGWQIPYLWLLPIAIAFEILAFLVPMLAFHQEMIRQKKALHQDADVLSRKILLAQTQLLDTGSDAERTALNQQITAMTDRYWAIERLQTWPVDTQLWRKFAVNNSALLLPVVTNVLHHAEIFSRTLAILKRLFTSTP